MEYEKIFCRRGEIYIADLGNAFGHEQQGIRPVVIIQNDVGNLYSPTVSVCPLTTQDKKPGQPTHCRLEIEKYPFLRASSTVLCEQTRTLDKRRLGRYSGEVDKKDMKRIDEALRVHFGFDIPEAIDAP